MTGGARAAVQAAQLRLATFELEAEAALEERRREGDARRAALLQAPHPNPNPNPNPDPDPDPNPNPNPNRNPDPNPNPNPRRSSGSAKQR